MKKFKWIIFLLILCAALSFWTSVGAEGLSLNFGPIGVSSGSGYRSAIDAVTAPLCHDSSDTCNASEKVAELRKVFAENKLVPQGEWLENKLRETQKAIETDGCGSYSEEKTINSIVADHINYCKTTANPHFHEHPENIMDVFYAFGKVAIEVKEAIIKKYADAEESTGSIEEYHEKIDNDKLWEYIKSHNDYFAYQNNCQATALSYAMCRQGYDVQAHGQKGYRYGRMNDGDYIRIVLINSILEPEHIYYRDEWKDRTTLEEIEEKMAGWPDGTIIYIGIGLHGENDVGLPIEGGHAFSAEKVNGEIVFIDPQRPEKSSKEVRDYFNRVDESKNNFFFVTNDIDFKHKLNQLTLWVDKKEVVEQTKY